MENFIIGFFIAIVICLSITLAKWEHHSTLLKHNLAYYDTHTGEFKLKTIPKEPHEQRAN